MCLSVTAAVDIGVVIGDSAPAVQHPASNAATPLAAAARRHADLRSTAVRYSRTKSPPSATFLTRNASARNAKPRISPRITDARTRPVAITGAGNTTARIPTGFTSSGISATWYAGTGISTGSRNGADAGHVAGYYWSR